MSKLTSNRSWTRGTKYILLNHADIIRHLTTEVDNFVIPSKGDYNNTNKRTDIIRSIIYKAIRAYQTIRVLEGNARRILTRNHSLYNFLNDFVIVFIAFIATLYIIFI